MILNIAHCRNWKAWLYAGVFVTCAVVLSSASAEEPEPKPFTLPPVGTLTPDNQPDNQSEKTPDDLDTANPAYRPANELVRQARELLSILHIDESVLRKSLQGVTLSEEDLEVLLEMLFRLPQADLERHVVPKLHGQDVVVLALAVDRDAPEHQTPGDEADDECCDPRADPELDDAARLVGDLVVGVARQPAALHLIRASAQGDGDDSGETGHLHGWSPLAAWLFRVLVRVHGGPLTRVPFDAPPRAGSRHPGPSSSTREA